METPASLFPVRLVFLVQEDQKRSAQRMLYESPRKSRIDEASKASFLSTLPEEERQRYQGEIWSHVYLNGMHEKDMGIVLRYGTQSVMKMGPNQTITLEVSEKMMELIESDGLTESVTEESAEDSPITKNQPMKIAKKGLWKYKLMLRKLKSKVNNKGTNSNVIQSRAAAVVTSLTKTPLLSKTDKEVLQCVIEEKR